MPLRNRGSQHAGEAPPKEYESTMVANERSYILLSFSGSQNGNGTVSADTIYKNLMDQRIWFISRKPKYLVPGAVVLFYQSAMGVRGNATVAQVYDNSRADFEALENLGLYQLRFKLALSGIQKFEKPIPLGPMVHDLEFVANKKYWGHSVRGTPRQIPAVDFNKILEATRITALFS